MLQRLSSALIRHGRTLLDMVLSVTPEQYGAIGDGNADDTLPVKMACESGRPVRFGNGKTYRVVMSEDNVIKPKAGTIINLNGATLSHETQGYLVFLLVNPDITIKNGSLLYKGTYPASAVQTTRYGITRPHEAAFTGFIGLYQNAKRTCLQDLSVSGNSNTALYDFLVSGYEGSFRGSVITRIHGTHYSDLIINNLTGCHISYIEGTLRHNKSHNVYGPSHLLYVNVDNGSIDHIREYGELLDNTGGTAGNTVQTTGTTDASITDIVTTMKNVGALSMKGKSHACQVRGVTSHSPSDVNSHIMRCVEIQTNLKDTITYTTFDDITVYLPSGNPSAIGIWIGGSYTKMRNANVHVPNARQVEPVYLVTSQYSDVDITVTTPVQDTRVYVSQFDRCRAKINCTDAGIMLTDGTSQSGGSWGTSSKSEFVLNDIMSPVQISQHGLSWATANACSITYSESSQGDYYTHIINQSSTTNLQLHMKMPNQAVHANSGNHNARFYKAHLAASTIQGAQAVLGELNLIVLAASSGTTLKVEEVNHTKATGTGDITFSASIEDDTIIFTAIRGGGTENLKDFTLRVKEINCHPHVA